MWFNDSRMKWENVVRKPNGEFEETVVTGLEEIKAELRRTNQRLDATNEHQTILSERQALLGERQALLGERQAHLQAHLGERQELLTERQNLLHEQVVATDKKVDRVITGLSTLLDKVERLS